MPIVRVLVGGLVVLVLLFRVVVVVQGAVAAYRLRESAARAASATPTPSPSPKPDPTPYSGDLKDLLLPLPSGATPVTVDQLTADMTDIQRIGMIWNRNDPTIMTNALTLYGFKRSADREWSLGGSTVLLALLQFAHPLGATNWFNAVYSQGFSGPDVEATDPILSTSIRDSRYATFKFTDGSRQQIGLAVAGEFAILVEVTTYSPQTDFPTLQNVAVSQYQRLPPS